MLNTHASDLFFNLERDDVTLTDEKGAFRGWDEPKLLAQAKWFCECLADHLEHHGRYIEPGAARGGPCPRRHDGPSQTQRLNLNSTGATLMAKKNTTHDQLKLPAARKTRSFFHMPFVQFQELREKLPPMTNEALGEHIGVTGGAISGWERGNYAPKTAVRAMRDLIRELTPTPAQTRPAAWLVTATTPIDVEAFERMSGTIKGVRAKRVDDMLDTSR